MSSKDLAREIGRYNKAINERDLTATRASLKRMRACVGRLEAALPRPVVAPTSPSVTLDRVQQLLDERFRLVLAAHGHHPDVPITVFGLHGNGDA